MQQKIEVKKLDNILRRIGSIARALDSISNIEFREINLTRGQYLYLVRICENPGLIQERLSEILKVDKTTTARAINKLVETGYIEKREDPNNKKNKKLYPTPKGEESYNFLIKEDQYSNESALQGFDPSEVETLYHLLMRVDENINEDWQDVKKGKKRSY